MSKILIIGNPVKPLVEELERTVAARSAVEWMESGRSALVDHSVGEVDSVICSSELVDLDPVDVIHRLRQNHPNITAVIVDVNNRFAERSDRLLEVSNINVIVGANVRDLIGQIREHLASRAIDAEIHRHDRLTSTVNSILQTILTAADEPEIASIVCNQLVESGLYTSCWWTSSEKESNTLVPVAAAGIDVAWLSSRSISLEVDEPESLVRTTTDSSDELTTLEITFRTEEQLFGTIQLVTRAAVHQPECETLERFGRVISTRLEEIEARSTSELSVEQFSRAIIHEFRNYIQISNSYATLVRETGDVETHGDSLLVVLERIERLLEQIAALGHQNPADQFEYRSLKETASRCWRHVGKSSATCLVVESAPIEANHLLLEILLENLFRNSLDQRPDVTIEIGLLENGFYVEDDGPGISKDFGEDIFEWGVSDTASGTGVGLALVNHVGTLHGWEVSVTESENGGARFEITSVTRRSDTDS